MNDGKKILGLKVAESGCLYYHRRVGGVDMHVSGAGGLLAIAPKGGEACLPNAVDIRDLRNRGVVASVSMVVSDEDTVEAPIRFVDVIPTRPAPKILDVVEMMTPVPLIMSDDGSERHGPPSPQEQADHIASTLAFEAVTNHNLSARGAYEYYRAALRHHNKQHRTGEIERMTPSDFDRLIALARFLIEDAAEPPCGATVH